MIRRLWSAMTLAVALVVLGGCAHTSEAVVTEMPMEVSRILDVPLETAWIATRDALLERDLNIYTRDKRGVYVVYSKERRRLMLPTRTEYTITLEAASDTTTKVSVSTVHQKYRVTLLTYPDWSSTPVADDGFGAALLEELAAGGA